MLCERLMTLAFASRCAEGHCCVWIVRSIKPFTSINSGVRRLFHRCYQPSHILRACIDTRRARRTTIKTNFPSWSASCTLQISHPTYEQYLVESLQRRCILYPFALLRCLASAAKPPRPPGPPPPHIIEEQRRRREMLAVQAAEEQTASPVS